MRLIVLRPERAAGADVTEALKESCQMLVEQPLEVTTKHLPRVKVTSAAIPATRAPLASWAVPLGRVRSGSAQRIEGQSSRTRWFPQIAATCRSTRAKRSITRRRSKAESSPSVLHFRQVRPRVQPVPISPLVFMAELLVASAPSLLCFRRSDCRQNGAISRRNGVRTPPPRLFPDLHPKPARC